MAAAISAAKAQTVYIGNDLSNPVIQGGGEDGGSPLVILGEYDPSGPLATAVASKTLPAGTVQDVRFYGQSYNFTLYALAYVGPGPNPSEQTFQVIASESFSGPSPGPETNILAVTNFTVDAGDLLAYAGQGPYYPQGTYPSNDTLNSDATYQDSTNPSSSTTTPPGGVGSEFTVGIYTDTNATYGYITDFFGNQG